MPGLVGIVSNNTEDELLLDKMANSVKHKPWQLIEKFNRTPFRIARVHLGIFNIEPQPIFNEDKTIGIFMYGRIYGYESDMKELMRFHKFTSQNGAEFCLHAYEEYGKEFAKRVKLNGDFLLVICDFKKKELVLVNDRFGLVPLHYAITNHRLVFASEAKAILQNDAFRKELNNEAVADFLAFGTMHGNKTFFRGMEILPPASVLTYDGQSISLERYWKMSYEPDYSIPEEEFAERLAQAIRKAMAIRMDEHLRYGIGLSGGYDSRTLLAAVDKQKRKELITFTFGIPKCDDVRIAEVVARVAGAKHTYLPTVPEEGLGPYPEQFVYFTDGMFQIHASFTIPFYEKTKQHIDVYCEDIGFGTAIGGRYLNKAAFKVENSEQLVEMLNKGRILSDQEMAQLFHRGFYEQIKEIPVQTLRSSLAEEITHPANRLDYYTLSNRNRRIGLAGYSPLIRNFVEVIAPTFDTDVFDVILKIPPELRSGHRIYRKLLRKLDPKLARITYQGTMIRADAPLWMWKPAEYYLMGRRRLSRELYRISRGRINIPYLSNFAPFDEWLRTNENWRRFTNDTLIKRTALINEFCRQENIQIIVEEHQNGRRSNGGKINQLMTLELFLRLFMEGSLKGLHV